jgi:hypothetical protein
VGELDQVTVEERKEEDSHCKKHTTTGKISTEVSMDIKMEEWRGSVLLENEVFAIFL